jgi:hypothetical protein
LDNRIEPDLKKEADRILNACGEARIEVRLLGGLAIQIALGERINPAFARTPGDIDLITSRKYCTEFEGLVGELGWEADRQFNALNGSRRLLFRDPEDPERKIDGFVDSFEMCHKLPLVDRISVHPRLLSPADLILTKLQIIELNKKDRNDCYALLLGFPVETGKEKDDAISIDWIAELLARDWGLNHTVEFNLNRLASQVEDTSLGSAELATIRNRIEFLREGISAAPKTISWKVRACIGERKKWYDEPEEVDRI